MLRFPRNLACLLFAIAASSLHAQRYEAGDIVENFTLVNRANGQPVSLSDFEGKIVFLEWFAYWCPFCQAAAADVEEGIVRHYQTSDGNPNGVPVMHVGLNLQGDAEDLSQEFIDKYHMQFVLNDFNRAVANRFQSSGQPIFAIINGVANSPSHRQWELLLTHLGYGQLNAPTASFRQAIDSVQAGVAGEAPTISQQPQGAKIPTGSSHTLSVAVESDWDATYSWSKDGAALPAATGASLLFENADLSDGGSYVVTVSNASGQVVSDPARLEVVPSLADFVADADLPSDLREADDDPDRDGFNNLFEYLAGTDPSDRESQPATVFQVVEADAAGYAQFTTTRSERSAGFALQADFNSLPDFTGENHPAEHSQTPFADGSAHVSIRCATPLSQSPVFGRLVAKPE